MNAVRGDLGWRDLMRRNLAGCQNIVVTNRHWCHFHLVALKYWQGFSHLKGRKSKINLTQTCSGHFLSQRIKFMLAGDCVAGDEYKRHTACILECELCWIVEQPLSKGHTRKRQPCRVRKFSAWGECRLIEDTAWRTWVEAYVVVKSDDLHC